MRFFARNVISFLLAAYIWSTTLNLIMMQSATIALCEKKSAENYALGAEIAGKEKMKEGLAEKKKAIEDAEAQLKCLIRKLTYNHNETFEDMAKQVDRGYSGREAQQWSKLLYLPFLIMPEKDVNSNIRSWLQLSEYEASVEEQIVKVSDINLIQTPM